MESIEVGPAPGASSSDQPRTPFHVRSEMGVAMAKRLGAWYVMYLYFHSLLTHTNTRLIDLGLEIGLFLYFFPNQLLFFSAYIECSARDPKSFRPIFQEILKALDQVKTSSSSLPSSPRGLGSFRGDKKNSAPSFLFQVS